jgi:hypothetical protein
LTAFVCFRVRVEAGAVPNLFEPYREPIKMTDDFALRQSAIECARLASATGAAVTCELVTMEDGAEVSTPVEWREAAA